MLWLSLAIAGPHPDKAKCDEGDTDACARFIGLAARAWVDSPEPRNAPLLLRRWRERLDRHDRSVCTDTDTSDCGILCDATHPLACERWSQQPVEALTASPSDMLVTQRACDSGAQAACDVIEDNGIARVYPVKGRILGLLPEGVLLEQGKPGPWVTPTRQGLMVDEGNIYFPHIGDLLFLRGEDPGLLVGLGGRWIGGPTGQHMGLFPAVGRAPRRCSGLVTEDHIVIPDEGCERWSVHPRHGGEARWVHELQRRNTLTSVGEDLLILDPRRDGSLRRIGVDGTLRWETPYSGHDGPVSASVEADLIATPDGLFRLDDGSPLRPLPSCTVDGTLLVCETLDDLIVYDTADLDRPLITFEGWKRVQTVHVDGARRRIAYGKVMLVFEGGEAFAEPSEPGPRFRYPKTVQGRVLRDGGPVEGAEVDATVLVGLSMVRVDGAVTDDQGQFQVRTPGTLPTALFVDDARFIVAGPTAEIELTQHQLDQTFGNPVLDGCEMVDGSACLKRLRRLKRDEEPVLYASDPARLSIERPRLPEEPQEPERVLTVLDSDGKPVEGLEVHCSDRDRGTSVTAVTDHEGRAVLSGHVIACGVGRLGEEIVYLPATVQAAGSASLDRVPVRLSAEALRGPWSCENTVETLPEEQVEELAPGVWEHVYELVVVESADAIWLVRDQRFERCERAE